MLHSKRRNRRVKEKDKRGMTEDRQASSWADQSGVTERPKMHQCPEHGSSTPMLSQLKCRDYPAAVQPSYNNVLPLGRGERRWILLDVKRKQKEVAETTITWVS